MEGLSSSYVQYRDRDEDFLPLPLLFLFRPCFFWPLTDSAHFPVLDYFIIILLPKKHPHFLFFQPCSPPHTRKAQNTADYPPDFLGAELGESKKKGHKKAVILSFWSSPFYFFWFLFHFVPLFCPFNSCLLAPSLTPLLIQPLLDPFTIPIPTPTPSARPPASLPFHPLFFLSHQFSLAV